jgi:transposase InsO family protein
MAYSTNPYLPKARATAMRLLLLNKLPLSVIADRCGVHRSTIWRWKRKWNKLNEHHQFTNYNRPDRKAGTSFRWADAHWNIPTDSSRPHGHPKAITPNVVQQVLAVRRELGRCAEVVWHQLITVLNVRVSLSSVRRILKRAGVARGRKKRVRPDNPRRPRVTKPGELVETDTIHHVDPLSGKRLYYYTVFDLFTRMTHVTLAPKLSPGLAAQAVLEAQHNWGISICMVQTDNGPEYGRYFEQVFKAHGITTRHTRLHRPNDNAHIERFNRTIQTESIGYRWRRGVPLQRQRDTLAAYLDYYNTRRVHLDIQMQVPTAMLQRF